MGYINIIRSGSESKSRYNQHHSKRTAVVHVDLVDSLSVMVEAELPFIHYKYSKSSTVRFRIQILTHPVVL